MAKKNPFADVRSGGSSTAGGNETNRERAKRLGEQHSAVARNKGRAARKKAESNPLNNLPKIPTPQGVITKTLKKQTDK